MVLELYFPNRENGSESEVTVIRIRIRWVVVALASDDDAFAAALGRPPNR
jgi:hypothetical protein